MAPLVGNICANLIANGIIGRTSHTHSPTQMTWVQNYNVSSGRFRGGSRGSLEPPSGAKLFHFHGEFQVV